MPEIKVTVIVPTYQGANKIGVLINALKKQSIPPIEIIVVIDGSTDSTEEVVATFKSSLQIRVLKQKNKGRAVSRNEGAKMASGDILVFYDDDMEPHEDSIYRHIQFHQHQIGLVCGLPLEVVSAKKSDILNYKATRAAGWLSAYSDTLNRLDLENLFFTTSNCSIPISFFKVLHGFDMRLTDAEDFDLAYRAIENDIPVFFDKENIAIHHERITCKSFIVRTRQYQDAHDRLRALHPTRLHPAKPSKPSFMKRLFYAFFDFNFWIWVIDGTNLLKAMPQSWRFKIYDWVIYSQGVVNTPNKY